MTKKQLRIGIDAELHRQLKILSVETGKNFTRIVEEALQAYFNTIKQNK